MSKAFLILASVMIVNGLVFSAHAADSKAKRNTASSGSTEYYFNVSLHESLAIDGSTATITASCGSTVFSNWSVNGAMMTGDSCGGPVCGFKSTTKASATMRGSDVLLTEGRHQYIFVPAKDGSTGGMTCL